MHDEDVEVLVAEAVWLQRRHQADVEIGQQALGADHAGGHGQRRLLARAEAGDVLEALLEGRVRPDLAAQIGLLDLLAVVAAGGREIEGDDIVGGVAAALLGFFVDQDFHDRGARAAVHIVHQAGADVAHAVVVVIHHLVTDLVDLPARHLAALQTVEERVVAQPPAVDHLLDELHERIRRHVAGDVGFHERSPSGSMRQRQRCLYHAAAGPLQGGPAAQAAKAASHTAYHSSRRRSV